MEKTRRTFLKQSSIFVGAGLLGLHACGGDGQKTGGEDSKQDNTATAIPTKAMFFQISLAQWSLHKALFDKKMDNLDFAAKAASFGAEGLEYVNQFFKDKAKDLVYLREMNKRTGEYGLTNLLIMIDGEGGLAETDTKKRTEAIENHYKWVNAARFLGCHSIRVNAFSSNPSADEAAKAAVDGLGKLGEYSKAFGINIIVENHGGFSSNGAWLSGVIKQINMPNVGTLPDFGNFCIKRDNKTGNPWEGKCVEEYDRYLGVAEMMPYAKGVSAKAYDFDEQGNCIETDYAKMLKVVKDAGYSGFIGIEYEGEKLSEEEGIKATFNLLKKVGDELG